ncbi:phage tail tube protein [Pseudomonas guariconensis]|uniref:phage tail tube protein n=1 Tax=Pseudomonas guariconensis TaxID=1288410 RepID=UPI002D1F35DB|nr:phage tail tube protein [Pseudomonas guariconensis]MEB3843534.1 phage tail protein [Pseudomonas guariconensis]MEB3876402.1 phage tail protein [Pseudomonas guariconensis]MEB3881541.1 phage tail protein [Pseudomonas guariconensis]MEB3898156.1 phage tail protein [Pseudomonas guariconensis]
MTRRIPLPNGTTTWVTAKVDLVQFSLPPMSDASWIEVKKVTTPSHSGGDERFATFVPLGQYEDVSVPTGRDPIDIDLPVEDADAAAYLATIDKGRDTRVALGWRFTLPSGVHIAWVGYASGGLMPQMERNNLMVRNYRIRVIGSPKRITS